jgi:NAD(P)-dependent dehydrogenase (short-subunit alcohol dehydrogenase family)
MSTIAQLHDQVIVVTGAARGIGYTVAQACAQAGATVVMVDRLRSDLEAAVQGLLAHALRVEGVTCDLAQPAAVTELFDGIVKRHGVIDGLVNNAGTTVYGGFRDTSLEDLHRVLGLHLDPTLLCSQAVLGPMLSRGRGSIVNMASASAHRAIPRFFAYTVAKAGLIAMTQQMATELGGQGVRVNAIAPGPVLTEALKRNQNADVQKALREDIPMDRFAEPQEVAGCAVFLLSDMAAYVNGHVLTVDGGLSVAGTRLDRVAPASASSAAPPQAPSPVRT